MGQSKPGFSKHINPVIVGYTWSKMSKPTPRKLRIGVVNYLNTIPLIDGLDRLQDVELIPDVPSRLIDRLLTDEVDVALCSAFDYQQSAEPLQIVPAGVLGGDGPTMTVRLFSQLPIGRIQEVHCDTDSHTSVNLLHVLLHQVYGIRPQFVPFDARNFRDSDGATPRRWPDSMLLIGDKVVTDMTPAVRYPYQLDLGAAWKEATGLPFVFAAWMTKKDDDCASTNGTRLDRALLAYAILNHQRLHNLERLDSMIARRASINGWPTDLAKAYVTDMIQYEWTPAILDGLERYYECCYDLGLIKANRAVDVIPLPSGSWNSVASSSA